MKTITEEDIKKVELELAEARKEFESKEFNSLEEKLEWIRAFFNRYIPQLEKRLLPEKKSKDEWIFLPDELRIKFYEYFPEHGLTMANYSQELSKELQKAKKFPSIDRAYFRHWD